jgi:hypothetical protein
MKELVGMLGRAKHLHSSIARLFALLRVIDFRDNPCKLYN